jgi:DNA-binding HxlR family transcriptional regulator
MGGFTPDQPESTATATTAEAASRALPASAAGAGANALAEALDCVGDRWTLAIVAALLLGPRRFGDLERELDGISPNVLSARLQRLTDEGLLLAEPYSERPPRFAYSLTQRGRELAGPIRLLIGWAIRELGGAEPPVHEACGEHLEAAWYCPACERPVSEDEVSELHYA